MPEDPHVDTEAIDSQALEEWVEKTAETKGISRGEVLDQMLSSYWILEELTGMMDEAKPEEDIQGTETGRTTNKEEDSHTRNQSTSAAEGDDDNLFPEDDFSDLIREFQELRNAILDNQDRQHQSRVLEQSSHKRSNPEVGALDPVADGPLEYAISDLRDRIQTLSNRIEDVESGHEEDISELETDVEETIAILDTLEDAMEEEMATKSEIQSVKADVEDDLSRLDGNMTEVLGNVTQIEESLREMSTKVSSVYETTVELERRMEREFDGIERVFEHVLSKTEDIEYRIGGLSESHQEDLKPILEHVESKKRLDSLSREAARKGISAAVCDNCDSKVNLTLLNEPFCPGCDRPLSGIEKDSKWNPLSSPTLQTEPTTNSTQLGNETDDMDGDAVESARRMRGSEDR